MKSDRLKLTERIIQDMRIAVRKKTSQIGGTDYILFRAFKEQNPHVWWTESIAYTLSLFCEHNSHGEYSLQLSPSYHEKEIDFWFCWLQNGKWSQTFLHLKHLKYFDELNLIVFALTDMRLFENETLAKEYLDSLEDKK